MITFIVTDRTIQIWKSTSFFMSFLLTGNAKESSFWCSFCMSMSRFPCARYPSCVIHYAYKIKPTIFHLFPCTWHPSCVMRTMHAWCDVCFSIYPELIWVPGLTLGSWSSCTVAPTQSARVIMWSTLSMKNCMLYKLITLLKSYTI